MPSRRLGPPVLAALCALLPAAAFAAPAGFTVDDAKPKLAEADSGWTASLAFTNLTTDPITLSVTPTTAVEGCAPTLSEVALPASTKLGSKLTIPEACGTDATFTVAGAGTSVAIAPAEGDPPGRPDWNQLLAFPVALGIAAAGLLLVLMRWRPKAPEAPGDDATDEQRSAHGKAVEEHARAQAAHRALKPHRKVIERVTMALPHLGATYSFKDSWASNVTAVGALLAGLFGSSEVVKAAIGEKADTAIALATVGGAMALLLITAGGVVLLALKTRDGKAMTAGGLVAASTLTLGGAGGQLWVTHRAMADVDMGWVSDGAVVLFAVAVAILALYAVRSTGATLTTGTTAPADTPSDAEEAALLIVQALKEQPDIQLEEMIKGVRAGRLRRYPRHATSPGDETQRPRAALL